MNIYLASDHAGFELKERVKQFLTTLKDGDRPVYSVVDYGPYVLDPEDDYPDFIRLAARAVQTDQEGRGIIFGGSGQGEAMVANRHSNVRAAVYYGDGIRVEGGDEETAARVYDIVTLSREHNDANILSIGARFVAPVRAMFVVNQWLKTAFSGGERHVRRIEKIDRQAMISYNGDQYCR